MRTIRSTPYRMTERAAALALKRYAESVEQGRRLRWLREWAGLSQAEVAAYAGIGTTSYARVERGERSLVGSERACVARALGVSLAAMRPIRVQHERKPRALSAGLIDEPQLSLGLEASA